tara:strand:- start:474 stop:680 length:207 start_codon:yes stop_codon:yes gene_type:complete
MANPRYNNQVTNRRGAMGGGLMKKRPGYKAGKSVKSKFPDHSGDGKITQKDILMAKGVIPKNKTKGKA